MKTKSLGQELFELEYDVEGTIAPAWEDLCDVRRGNYQQLALRFLERVEKLEGDAIDADIEEMGDADTWPATHLRAVRGR